MQSMLDKAAQQAEEAAQQAEKDEEKEIKALRHKLVSAADAYGRKAVATYKKQAADRVGKFGKTESTVLRRVKRVYETKKQAEEKRHNEALRKLHEQHNKELKRLRDEWEKEVEEVCADYKQQYADASTDLRTWTDSVTSAVARFIGAVESAPLDVLREMAEKRSICITTPDGSETNINL